MEVGLSPGDFVLDGNPTPSPKGAQPPIFGQCPLWPNGWMHYDATWYGNFLFDGDPATPRKRAHPLPPNFWPMSIVAKRLNG